MDFSYKLIKRCVSYPENYSWFLVCNFLKKLNYASWLIKITSAHRELSDYHRMFLSLFSEMYAVKKRKKERIFS